MALDNLQVDYLIDPAFQIENLAGKPAVGGHIEVFEAGTDTKVITYQDFDGNVNPFKIPLHSDGRAVILADPSRKYDFYVYDSFNNLMFSRLNVTPNLSGNISIKGCDVYIYNTDGTLDITQQSIQNNIRRYEINTKHKSLGVEAPLYFVEDSDTATIIGFSGDDYATKEYVDSAVSSKLDITAYSSQSGDFLTDKFEYDDDNHITAYNHSAFAGGGGSGTIYEAGDHIDITNNVISVTGLPDSADVENAVNSAIEEVENKFEYNINNYITAYNNSAFAGTNYSAGDYVSIENDTISVTGLQPSGDYATHDDLTAYQPSGDYATKEDVESATSGKMDVTGMTAYQPSGDYATHDDLTAYQPAGDYYSASNPSGFITNDAITGLQPSGDYVTHDEMTAYQPSGNYATIEDVESAVSGKQDILSAGEGIQIIDNTISVTAQGGSGITAVNHDNTLSGNGNSEPLGLANAEDYVKQDDLTGYATTSLVSSVSSELYSAISGISGDFELVAGSGVELVDDPIEKTTTINVTAEGTPVTAIEQMIESATSGISAAISGSYTLVAGNGIQLTDDDNARTTTVSVSGDYATTADLTAKQDTLDYGYHDDAISSIDTSALYDTSAHARINTLAGRISNLSSDKLDASAFSEVSGDFYTKDNPSGFITGVDLSDYATTASVAEKLDTTAFSTVSGEFATHEEVESATSGKADKSSVVEYAHKPSADAISASYNSFVNVDAIFGQLNSNFYISPSSILQVPQIITATTGGLTAGNLTANEFGVSGGRTSTSYIGSAAGAFRIYANQYGITNPSIQLIGAATAEGNGIFIDVNGASGVDSWGRKTWNIKNGGSDTNPSFSMAGAATSHGNGVFIDVNGASGVDYAGNVKWQVGGPAAQLFNGGLDKKPAILLVSPPTSDAYSAQWSAAPYISAGDPSQGITLSYGPTASTPNVRVTPNGITANYTSSHASYTTADATVSRYTAYNDPDRIDWSLTGSVQKREIEYDADTSAITAIAGSAIGGGGGVSQSAFDELKQSYDALSALFATYSGQWLLPNEGEE